jgi:hypothetical protein
VPTEPHPSWFFADEDPATVLGGDETFPAQLGDGLAGGVGGDWGDVDLADGVFTIHRAFAKGRLKPYPKTARSRRRVPLRAVVVAALELLPAREDVLFPASGGGRVDIDNFRQREWVPALRAAGLRHRRIYDMRHTFATWSLAAGMSIFTLSRRMRTSVRMIDATYGHLAQDAEDQDRGLLDAYDGRNGAGGHDVGTNPGDRDGGGEAVKGESPAGAGLSWGSG